MNNNIINNKFDFYTVFLIQFMMCWIEETQYYIYVYNRSPYEYEFKTFIVVSW